MNARTATETPDADPAFALSVENGTRLNERIARALTQAIADGRHPTGTSLPPEAALCAAFGASRFTVREALRKLAKAGLIETRQGAGSRVVALSPRADYQHVYEDLEDLFEYALDTRLVIAGTRFSALGETEAHDVGAPTGSRWLRITGIRFDARGVRPISHVTVFVHERFAGLLEDVRETKGTIYGLVEARSGERIAEAVQEILAARMPAAAARALGCQQGAMAMKFVRRYCDDGHGVMLTSINWHAARRFRYRMRIKRGDWKASLPLGCCGGR